MTNKLWLLRPVGYSEDDLPVYWHSWYDKTFGLVVRAQDEHAARLRAQEHDNGSYRSEVHWLDCTQSTCTELTLSGPAEIIIVDEHWGG